MKQQQKQRSTKSDAAQRLRDRLQAVATQATQAQGMSAEDDNLLDLVDDIDRDLQAAIELINRLRRQEA